MNRIIASIVAAMVLASPVQGHAASFSFTGSFVGDDDLQTFTFSLAAPGTVTVRTFGYAGGTNAASSVIPAGGFDPILTVFLGTGPSAAIFNVNNDAGCPLVGTDPVTSACWDALLTLPGLPAGDYTLVLSQSDNSANGPTLGDGFGRDGQGNFTGPAFLGVPGSFIDANPAQRNANWAVDILDVDSASVPTAVPAPGTVGLLGLGLALLVGRVRRR